MMVRRDANGDIVWILDDDGDMDPDDPRPDRDSDCYVADYGGDGTVDRLLDYIDNDGDGKADEMGIRYFRESELKFNWLSFDIDGDGHMWNVGRYEYKRPFYLSDAYGDAMIFMNKYNPADRSWVPISECPFAFFDDDGDGYSERVVRYSAVPMAFLDNMSNPDYANSYKVFYGPFHDEMREMGALNIRYGHDVDGMSGPEHPLHYEMGFNLIGKQRYDFDGMEHFNELRRAPKTVITVPFEAALAHADTYPADATGFSFVEHEDASISIGDPENEPDSDRRWEGVFWIWSRRLMHNTGGPTQTWNIRREYRPTFSDRREVYYSPVDKRLHLKGATEGWIRIGKINSQEPLGECRMFDTDEDGYFDRWEYYARDSARPYRVARVPEADNIDFGDDWEAIGKFYREEVLPEAIRLNEQFLEAVAAFTEHAAAMPANLKAALEDAQSPTERRYVLDLMREHAWRHLEARLLEDGQAFFASQPTGQTSFTSEALESERVWKRQTRLSRIADFYARGEIAAAAEMLRSLREEMFAAPQP